MAGGGRHPRHRTTLSALGRRLDPEPRRVECGTSVERPTPVPIPRRRLQVPRARTERPKSYDGGGTIVCMPAGAAKIEVPRWIQLVGLPLLLLLLWVVAGAGRPGVFLLLLSFLPAPLLCPPVRLVARGRLPPRLSLPPA